MQLRETTGAVAAELCEEPWPGLYEPESLWKLELPHHFEHCFLWPWRDNYPVGVKRFLSSVDHLMSGFCRGVCDRTRLNFYLVPVSDDFPVPFCDYPELVGSIV